MRDISAFWTGGPLGQLELVCLLSMVRQGHAVRLFSYDKIRNVPAGITVTDAREILPRDEFIFHRKTGSAALGSDRFRYQMLKKGSGVWLDTDVLLVKPLDLEGDYIFGWADAQINCAVLYLPPDKAITSEIAEFANQKYPIPPFYDARTRSELARRAVAGFPIAVEDLGWGVLGPEAITFFVHKHDLLSQAQPPEVFYPVHWSEVHALLSRKHSSHNFIQPSTIGLHLYTAALRQPSKLRPNNPVGQTIIEKGCFVDNYAVAQLGFRMKGLC